MPTSRNLIPLLITGSVLSLMLLAIGVRDSDAYDSYSNGSATTKCAQCHESAAGGGFQSRGPLHDAHNASATSTCTRCHVQQGDVPATFRCVGCHGQATTGGAGLRKHHLLAGAPPDNNGMLCSDCHSFDPAPDPESSVPPYYGQADIIQTSPCNADGKEDFWSKTSGAPDGKGLDNDGDLLIDAQDSDCAPPACVDQDSDGYGNPGHASCPNGPALDCNDQSAAAHPGAAEIYDLLDNDCNSEVDEIKNVLFTDPANRNRVSWSAQSPAGQVYDVVRSDGAQFPAASANTLCLINNTAAIAADDLVLPAVGKAFFYLVRNTLVGNYGRNSSGSLRVIGTCP
jgi:hypothetical protein